MLLNTINESNLNEAFVGALPFLDRFLLAPPLNERAQCKVATANSGEGSSNVAGVCAQVFGALVFDGERDRVSAGLACFFRDGNDPSILDRIVSTSLISFGS